MTSEVAVMNNCMDRLGTSNIASRLDQTVPAQVMNRRYDNLRDTELCRRWRFAITRTELSALAQAPLGTYYTTQYQLPSDCLQLVQVSEFYVASMTDYRGGPEAVFVREGDKLLTNFPAPLFIRYVRRVVEANAYDAWFIEVLGARLAYELCEKITGSSSKKADMLKDFKLALNDAIAADAIECAPDVMPDAEWIMARINR